MLSFKRCVLTSALCALLMLAVSAQPTDAALIAYWNFNTYDGDALSISSSAGAGTITIDGTWPTTQLTAPAGSTTNALFSDPAGVSLGLGSSGTGGSNTNGKSLVISFSTVNYEDLILTFVTQRTTTGFNSNLVEYSTNGGGSYSALSAAAMTPASNPYDPAASFALITANFSAIAGLENIANALIRITFSGSSGATQSNRIDNAQINATFVPEPSSLIMLAFGAIMLFLVPRKKVNRRRVV